MNALVNSVRLRQLDRILGQWTDVEIEQMNAAQTCGIALLHELRHTLLEEVGAERQGSVRTNGPDALG